LLVKGFIIMLERLIQIVNKKFNETQHTE